MKTEWGLWDTEDSVWMGNDDGPVVFADYGIARIAAQVIDVQLGQVLARTQAKEYQHGPKRLRDTVDAKMSPLQALNAIENGRIQ